jgi:hypothetical protein
MSYLLRPERRGSSTLDSVVEALSKPPDIQLKVGSCYLVFLKWNFIESTVSSLHHRQFAHRQFAHTQTSTATTSREMSSNTLPKQSTSHHRSFFSTKSNPTQA